MKKFLALLMAVLMVLSCTVAFAEEYEEAKIDVREADDRYSIDGKELDTPKTELWLQVEATGQIDVTVPLVLVFQTTIDGGKATSPETYKITNNSTADLVVTKIATAVEAESDATNPMALVAYTDTPQEDEYKVQLSVKEETVKGAGESGAWDLYDNEHARVAKQGGLFELKKAVPNGEGTDTRVIADMTTGKLSFVTLTTGEGSEEKLDDTKGVHLLTVTYTVAIDTSDAIGETITDNGDATLNGVG